MLKVFQRRNDLLQAILALNLSFPPLLFVFILFSFLLFSPSWILRLDSSHLLNFFLHVNVGICPSNGKLLVISNCTLLYHQLYNRMGIYMPPKENNSYSSMLQQVINIHCNLKISQLFQSPHSLCKLYKKELSGQFSGYSLKITKN